MKFHWGHGILIALILIVVTFSTALILSFSDERNHELITDNYYAKELAFQDQIDRKNNAINAGKQLLAQQTQKGLEVSITPVPSGLDSGKVVLLRPSNQSLDMEQPLVAKGETVLPAEVLKRGKYVIQVNWSENGVAYYLEKDVFIQ